MTEAEKIAERIRSALPVLKTGALRFWGEWFGRPYDNIHQVVGCEADADILKIHFNEGETLWIWSPNSCVADGQSFSIKDADRVLWEWFSYGKPKTSANLSFEDFVRSGDGVAGTTNVDWYKPNFQPSLDLPAVEIL